MANRLTDVIKSIWNARTTTPIADLAALLQTVLWSFTSGLNVTGTVAVTGNETVSGTLGVTGVTTAGIINASGKLTVSAGGAAVTGGLAADTLTVSGVSVLTGGVNAPSGNAAIRLLTATYTYGNTTDNPNFVFSGSGTWQTVTGSPRTFNGTTASTGSGVAVTLMTAPTTNGVYLVFATLFPANDAGNYNCVAIVSTNGTSVKTTTIQTAALMSVTLSGQNIQATQGSGAAQPINWTILRIS